MGQQPYSKTCMQQKCKNKDLRAWHIVDYENILYDVKLRK